MFLCHSSIRTFKPKRFEPINIQYVSLFCHRVWNSCDKNFGNFQFTPNIHWKLYIWNNFRGMETNYYRSVLTKWWKRVRKHVRGRIFFCVLPWISVIIKLESMTNLSSNYTVSIIFYRHIRISMELNNNNY